MLSPLVCGRTSALKPFGVSIGTPGGRKPPSRSAWVGTQKHTTKKRLKTNFYGNSFFLLYRKANCFVNQNLMNLYHELKNTWEDLKRAKRIESLLFAKRKGKRIGADRMAPGMRSASCFASQQSIRKRDGFRHPFCQQTEHDITRSGRLPKRSKHSSTGGQRPYSTTF